MTIIIDKRGMASLPDSPIENGYIILRAILVIDEAHNYLGQKKYIFTTHNS